MSILNARIGQSIGFMVAAVILAIAADRARIYFHRTRKEARKAERIR